ncbi:hypothetical protein V1478_016615 [Vespula squamosa]|uniref:Uncharacterized protein n=1 Tax=Vespula squamosa TaxID=30214 RepID=A0ABD2A0D4_VESSQ
MWCSSLQPPHSSTIRFCRRTRFIFVSDSCNELSVDRHPKIEKSTKGKTAQVRTVASILSSRVPTGSYWSGIAVASGVSVEPSAVRVTAMKSIFNANVTRPNVLTKQRKLRDDGEKKRGINERKKDERKRDIRKDIDYNKIITFTKVAKDKSLLVMYVRRSTLQVHFPSSPKCILRNQYHRFPTSFTISRTEHPRISQRFYAEKLRMYNRARDSKGLSPVGSRVHKSRMTARGSEGKRGGAGAIDGRGGNAGAVVGRRSRRHCIMEDEDTL